MVGDRLFQSSLFLKNVFKLFVTSACIKSVRSTDHTIASVDGSTLLKISDTNGSIMSISNLSFLNGRTLLSGCLLVSPITVISTEISLTIQRIVRCNSTGNDSASSVLPGQEQHAMVTYVMELAATSVRIQSSIRALNQTFTTPLQFSIDWDDTPFQQGFVYWTAWTKGCVQNDGSKSGMCFGGGASWQNPFVTEPMPAAGSSNVYDLGEVGAGAIDAISIPMVTMIAPSGGATIMLSPEDPLLEVFLTVNPSSHVFSRR